MPERPREARRDASERIGLGQRGADLGGRDAPGEQRAVEAEQARAQVGLPVADARGRGAEGWPSRASARSVPGSSITRSSQLRAGLDRPCATLVCRPAESRVSVQKSNIALARAVMLTTSATRPAGLASAASAWGRRSAGERRRRRPMAPASTCGRLARARRAPSEWAMTSTGRSGATGAAGRRARPWRAPLRACGRRPARACRARSSRRRGPDRPCRRDAGGGAS